MECIEASVREARVRDAVCMRGVPGRGRREGSVQCTNGLFVPRTVFCLEVSRTATKRRLVHPHHHPRALFSFVTHDTNSSSSSTIDPQTLPPHDPPQLIFVPTGGAVDISSFTLTFPHSPSRRYTGSEPTGSIQPTASRDIESSRIPGRNSRHTLTASTASLPHCRTQWSVLRVIRLGGRFLPGQLPRHPPASRPPALVETSLAPPRDTSGMTPSPPPSWAPSSSPPRPQPEPTNHRFPSPPVGSDARTHPQAAPGRRETW